MAIDSKHLVDPARIGVMGESAGGCLAAALALLARDRREYAVAFQHLIYPMLDDRTCALADPQPYAGEFLWTAVISCGALDLLIEEDLEYARRLMRSGVPVELHVYPGAFHGFDLSPDAPVAVDARRDSLTALRRALKVP